MPPPGQPDTAGHFSWPASTGLPGCPDCTSFPSTTPVFRRRGARRTLHTPGTGRATEWFRVLSCHRDRPQWTCPACLSGRPASGPWCHPSATGTGVGNQPPCPARRAGPPGRGRPCPVALDSGCGPAGEWPAGIAGGRHDPRSGHRRWLQPGAGCAVPKSQPRLSSVAGMTAWLRSISWVRFRLQALSKNSVYCCSWRDGGQAWRYITGGVTAVRFNQLVPCAWISKTATFAFRPPTISTHQRSPPNPLPLPPRHLQQGRPFGQTGHWWIPCAPRCRANGLFSLSDQLEKVPVSPGRWISRPDSATRTERQLQQMAAVGGSRPREGADVHNAEQGPLRARQWTRSTIPDR